MRIEIPRVDAASLGALFFMLEAAVVYSGFLYGIDPLDQPGVELGKQLTYAMMGRSGFGEQRDKMETREAPEERWIVS